MNCSYPPSVFDRKYVMRTANKLALEAIVIICSFFLKEYSITELPTIDLIILVPIVLAFSALILSCTVTPVAILHKDGSSVKDFFHLEKTRLN